MFPSLIAKVLAFIFRRARPPGRPAALPAAVSRVAVVCTGGVGDVLLATPAIRAIKQTHPRCRVTAVVHHKRIDMLRFNPYVDELLPLKKSLFHYAGIHKRLKAEPPDIVFLFHANDPYIYCLAALACPGGLVGFQSPNPFSFLLDRAFAFDGGLHAIENNLKLVSLIGARTGDLSMDFSPGDGNRQAAERFFNQARYAVGFQLGSGFAVKCWPIAKYAELANRLLVRLDVRIILLASPKEKPLAEELNRLLAGRAVAAVTDLPTAAEVIRRLDVLVTPDTGPMHMAIALKCPIVALTGPTHPKNFGSLDNATKHVKIHRAASDEPYVKLADDAQGLMRQISPDEVYEAVLSLLEVAPPGRKPAPGAEGRTPLPL